jgi:hypothetical protein
MGRPRGRLAVWLTCPGGLVDAMRHEPELEHYESCEDYDRQDERR